MSYSPPPSVVRVHDWKRFSFTHPGNPASNVFNPDFTTDAGKDYLQTVMSFAGIYIAMGIIFFIVIGLANVFSCCCARVQRKSDKKTSTCCSLLFGARVWFLGGVIILLAGTAAALAQVAAFRNATNDTVDAADHLDSILYNASSLVATGFVPAIGGLSGSLVKLKNDAQSGGAQPQIVDAIQALVDAVAAANSSSSSFATKLTQTSDAFSSKLHGDNGIKDGVGKMVYTGGIAALALFFGMLILASFGLIATKAASRYFAVCNVFIIISLLLVYIFSGLFASVSVILADVCVAPTPALTSIVKLANVDNLVADTVTYYTSCGAAGANVAPMGAYAQIVNGSAYLTQTRTGLDGVSQAFAGMGDHRFDAQIALAGSNLTATNTSLNGVISYVSCKPVYGVFDEVLEAVCGDAAPAIIATWGLGTAACVLIFIIVVSATRLCYAHPGAIIDDTSSGSGATPAKVGGHAHSHSGVPQPTVVHMGAGPTFVAAAPQASGPMAGSAASYGSVPPQTLAGYDQKY